MKLLKIFILMLIWQFVGSERKVAFSGEKVICKEFNKNYFYNITCDIQLINRNKQLYNFNFSFKPKTIEGLKLRMKTYYKFRTVYRPIGVSMDDDACQYVKFLNGTLLITLDNFKNLPMHYLNAVCPIKGADRLRCKGFGNKSFTFSRYRSDRRLVFRDDFLYYSRRRGDIFS